MALKQAESERIHAYISKFKEFRRFFVGIISNEGIINMFLKGVCGTLKKHALSLKAKNLLWPLFI